MVMFQGVNDSGHLPGRKLGSDDDEVSKGAGAKQRAVSPTSKGMLKRGAPLLSCTRLTSWKEYPQAEINAKIRSRRRVGPGISSVARGRSPKPQRPAMKVRNRGS